MTEVTLIYGEVSQKFEIEHAQNILAFEKRLNVENWKLSDSDYELEDGIIKRKSTKPDKTAQK